METHRIAGRFGWSYTPRAIGIILLLATALTGSVKIAVAWAQSDRPARAEPVSSDRCRQGYVWREAFAGDHVCVVPEIRRATAQDNATAAKRRRSKSTDACIEGYVWRMASPDDHVCVTQQVRDDTWRDNRLAASRLAGFATMPPVTFATRMGGPLPPQKAGCYHLDRGIWQELQCATEDEIRKSEFFPLQPETAIQTEPVVVTSKGNPLTNTDPIVWGSFEFSWLSDPRQAAETDSQVGANAFGIQVNTEFFDCLVCKKGVPFSRSEAGDKGWVQFTFNTHPETGPKTGNSALCITLWDMSSTPLQNTIKCAPFMTAISTLTGPNAVFAGGNLGEYYGGEVIGYVSCPTQGSGSGCLVWAVGYLPWTGGWYSVSASDVVGLSGNWHQVSGGVFGFDNGSKAVFSEASPGQVQMVNTLRAYACIVEPQVANQFTPQPCSPGLVNARTRPFRISATDPAVHPTAESNNLTYGQPIFACGDYDCWVVYNASAP